MSTWLLNGETLQAHGITKCVIARRAWAADTLEFTIEAEDPLADPAFAFGDAITLTRDGVAEFVGKIVREQARGGRDGNDQPYVAANAWHDLERTIYQQTRCLADEAMTAGVFLESLSPHVVLGQTPLGGSYLTTTAQMLAVLTYAITKGVELTPGSIGGGVPFSREEAQSLTCAEVLRRLGALTPDAVTWFDYTTATPTLHYGRRATLDAVTYDLDDADAVLAVRVEKRQDLVPTGVRFIFVHSETSDEDGLRYTRATTQEAGTPDFPGGLIATIEVQGGDTATPAPIPGNMALEYYAALQTAPFEGQLVTQGADVRGDLRVGHVLNLAGGRTAWETMRALVIGVSEDIVTGVTEVEFGTPDRLPAQDFVDQLMFIRRVRLSTNLQAVRTCRINGPDIDDEGDVAGTGTEEEDNPLIGRPPRLASLAQDLSDAAAAPAPSGSGQVGQVSIELCPSGTAHVLGYIA